jgi:hypothetical protein
MDGFRQLQPPKPGEIAVSIKVRVTSGCFHREHSPKAYCMIEHHLYSISPDQAVFEFQEHESGPEILVYLAVTTAGLTLAKSVIDLVTAIIKARCDGIRQGDKPNDPLELIIRRTCKEGQFTEDKVLRVGPHENVDRSVIEQDLKKAAEKLIKEEQKEKDASNS